jgi:epoxyqueuosine reductase
VDGLAEKLRARARAEGFDAVRITAAADDPQSANRLQAFLAQGFHGDMDWMAETADRRAGILRLWPEAKTAIVLAQNYGPDFDPLQRLARKDRAVIASYALNRDYHGMVKGKLKRLGQWLSHVSKSKVKVFCDTAPLMEKPLAARAGLGWLGKHTNLVSRDLGSWFFIGTIVTTASLELDEAESDHCGTCSQCLDICPTKAFSAPYQLDARRCISYLTIEHRGQIGHEFRKAMGNRIYGCDDCLAVCPWNKFAKSAFDVKLKARQDLVAPALRDLLGLDDSGFRKLFSGSPIKRIGRDRFIRNVLIAAGNSRDASLLPMLVPLLADPSPLVRAMAVWALAQLAEPEDFKILKHRHAVLEADPDVCREWDAA